MAANVGTKPRRRRRVRERTLASAVGWSVLVTIALGLLAFTMEIATPGTPLRNFWDLVVVNGQVAPDNPLIAQFLNEIRVQDILLASFVCVIGGGITLGRLAPRSRTRRATGWAAAIISTVIMLICVALGIVLSLMLRGGHLSTGEIDTRLVITQIGWTVVWALAYVAGTMLGLRWRDRKTAHAEPALKELSRH